jgi:two-component system, LuxR family, response regulator FixJ
VSQIGCDRLDWLFEVIRLRLFMDVDHVIHLIDDDPAILDSIAGFLRTRGFSVRTYGGPDDFLRAAGPEIAGCLVTDVRMPGMSGLELVTRMGELGLALPTIFMTAYADIALKLEVSKRDAIDVLEKPFKNTSLIKAIRKALHLENETEADEPSAELLRNRFLSLTEPEKQVLKLLVELKSNSAIARDLGISVRALERQRATIMLKMHAATLAELVSMGPVVVST